MSLLMFDTDSDLHMHALSSFAASQRTEMLMGTLSR